MAGASPGPARWPPLKGRWLALHRTASGDRLELVTVRLAPGNTPCTAHDTVVTVSGLPAEEKVPFLIQWDRLKVGPVESVWPDPRFLYPGESQSVQLKGNRWFTLAAYGNAEPGLIYNYRLVLRSGEIFQTFAQLHVVSMDGPPRVVWAGDLDRDGGLDLLGDLTTDYVGHQYVLYASTPGSTGKLVTEASRLEVSGC